MHFSNNKIVNFILNADSYKFSHFKQLPPTAQCLTSYIEARSNKVHEELVFFGIQMFIKEYMVCKITMEAIDEAEAFASQHGVPFYREGWEIVVNELDGNIPLEIYAVPEGGTYPIRTVLATVTNTDTRFAWLTSYVETAILRGVWYPSTVCTASNQIRKLIAKYLEKTGTPEAVDYKLHDFGARGASCFEEAGIGGAAHLVNFNGTDTITGIIFSDRYYGSGVCGHSIPASEHSTVTSWGRDGEIDMFDNHIEQFGDGLFACVIDSWDAFAAVDKWKTLESKILEKGGTLVLRPDSGDPVKIPVAIVEKALDVFGYKTNDKGYKVLPDHIRVIQGDGVNYSSINEILSILESKGISADNIAFGMGGALIHNHTRDDLGWAMKASAVFILGEGWRDVYKDPATDPGKKSKRGIWSTYLIDDEIVSLPIYKGQELMSIDETKIKEILRPIYKESELLVEEDFDTIRDRARAA